LCHMGIPKPEMLPRWVPTLKVVRRETTSGGASEKYGLVKQAKRFANTSRTDFLVYGHP
jgi:hypothetical protein